MRSGWTASDSGPEAEFGVHGSEPSHSVIRIMPLNSLCSTGSENITKVI